MKYRRAETQDIESIKKVLSETWRDTYGSFLPESIIRIATSEWHAPNVLEAEILRPTTYFGVSIEDRSQKVVGLITAHFQEDVLFVARMYVLPDYQRRGIGNRLMAEASSVFPMARQIRLEVERENPKGISFYQKCGFVEVGTKIEVIQETQLCLFVMQRSLSC